MVDSASGTTGVAPSAGAASAYDNTGAAIHVTTTGAVTDSPTYEVDGTASGLGFPAIDTYRNGVLEGGGGVYNGIWASEVALVPGDNVITAGPELGSGVASDNAIHVLYEPATYTAAYGDPVNVSIDQAGGETAQAVQTLSGRISSNLFGTRLVAGTALTLSEGSTVLGRTTVAADGTWSAQVTLPDQGDHLVTVSETDLAGNTGEASVLFHLQGGVGGAPTPSPTSAPAPAHIATTPPTVAFGPAPQLGGTTAILSGTVSDAVGITGVEIYDGSTDLGAATVGYGGSWAFSHDFGQGTYDHLTAVATDPAGLSTTASASYDLVTSLFGRRSSGVVETLAADGSVASATTMAADGTVGAQTVSNGDGTATSTGYENGQSLFSIGNDVMTGNGYREDFVFQPTMGHARVTDFVSSGAGHDTLTLSHADFANVAQVLASTTMSHGAAVIHVSPTDTIRLAGVTRAELAQHRGDFAFTS